MADLNEKDLETPEIADDSKAKAKNVKLKERKPNFLVRMCKRIGTFVRECVSEMKKVTWLSRADTFKSSLVVVVIAVALAVVIGVLDTGLELGINGLRDLGKHIR